MANGIDTNIVVRGNNSVRELNLQAGANITAKVVDIKVIVNNAQSRQPQTIKTIPVAKPTSKLIKKMIDFATCVNLACY